MQGRLSGKLVSAQIRSRCAACDSHVDFTVDSEFTWRIDAGPPSPLIFQPSIDWANFHAPTIVNDY